MNLTFSVILEGAKIRKCAENAAEYVERQYQLLLEDFCRPLRAGIQGLLRNSPQPENLKLISDIVVGRRFFERNIGFELIVPEKDLLLNCLPGSLYILSPTKPNLARLVVGVGEPVSEIQSPVLRFEVFDGTLVESSKYRLYEYQVYFEAYRHHLKLLKGLEKVPFSDYIVGSELKICPPEYLKAGISPNLGCLTEKPANLRKSPTVQDVHRLLMTKLEVSENKSIKDAVDESFWSQLVSEDILDESQIRAVKMCLSQEVALIQGPPGTGKSYLGTKLVQILLTNRALWTKKSVSPVLVVCYTNTALDQFLEDLLPFTQRIVRVGSRSKSDDLDSFALHRIRHHMKEAMLRNQGLYNSEKDLASQLYQLNLTCRRAASISQEDLSTHRNLVSELENISTVEGRMICKNADIVGITATGAAKYKNLIDELKPRIVLFEEAGEILESHVIACMPRSCAHLIMIGDHQQLRPQVASYQLSREESHDVSLFERLISVGFPYTRLNTQHRMVKEISSLLAPVYSDLIDHSSVLKRGRIPGLLRPLFFLKHDYSESSNQGGSKANQFEAEMSVRLSAYLINQGIRPRNISILTPYTGQLRLIRSFDCHADLITDTVDNYQGKENSVVILSLVRGGSESIGFLASENRVCVALSRARDAMIILGNLDQLVSASNIWNKIRTILEKQDALGDSLPLQCQTHRRTTSVHQVDDLVSLKNGGCAQDCKLTMPCGHQCLESCHGPAVRHRCGQVCPRTCPSGHPCSKPCDELCGPCQTRVERTLKCGHTALLACHERVDLAACQVVDLRSLPCGHQLTVTCGVDPGQCKEQCSAQLDCGHLCTSPCHFGQPDHTCSEPCSKICERNHPCQGKCGSPCVECTVLVDRELTCGHRASVPCSTDLRNFDCLQNCQRTLECGHPCRSLCYEPCDTDCRYRGELVLACGHSVQGRCADRPKCDQPCQQVLTCGHPCQNTCGAPCEENCTRLVPTGSSGKCSHSPMVPCSEARGNQSHRDHVCKERCGARMRCGHLCTGVCSQCERGVHAGCEEPCPRRLVCGHQCPALCGQLCPPCKLKSDIRCPHSKSGGKCGEMPRPCKEKCVWRCPHLKCSKKCGAKCSRSECTEKCALTLKCGHPCRAYCGERCVCAECGKGPSESPLVNLGCGCGLSEEEVASHAKSTEIHLFDCPRCRKVVFFSPWHKQIMEERMERVESLNDYFFSRSTKVEERKTELLIQVKSLMSPSTEEFCKFVRTSLDSRSKKLISSTDLAALEIQAKLLQALETDESLANLTKSVGGLKSANMNTIRDLTELRIPVIEEILMNIEILSYEEGLWKHCPNCKKIFQTKCECS